MNLPVRHTHLSPRLGPQTEDSTLTPMQSLTFMNDEQAVLELTWMGEEKGLAVTTFAEEKEPSPVISPPTFWKGLLLLVILLALAAGFAAGLVYLLTFAARAAWG